MIDISRGVDVRPRAMICFRLHNCFRRNRFWREWQGNEIPHRTQSLTSGMAPKSQTCRLCALSGSPKLKVMSFCNCIAGGSLRCRFFSTPRGTKVFLSLLGPLCHLPPVRYRLRLHVRSGGCVSHNPDFLSSSATQLLTPYHPVLSFACPLSASFDSHPASPAFS
jgi:hypothetical protein